MERKKVLMACVHSWNSPMRLGSHHIARGFVKNGWDVAFVSPPVTPFHLLSQRWDNLEFRVNNWLRGGAQDLEGHLWAYDSAALIVPKMRKGFDTDFVARHWMKTMMPSLSKRLKQKGFGKVDLLYFDTPILSFLLKKIDYKTSVLRVADNYHGFGAFPDSLLNELSTLAQNVDTVLYTAKSLEGYIDNLAPRQKMLFPNGVDFEHFYGGERSVPVEYQKINGRKAVYVGAIEKWFDFKLLEKSAEANPDLSFIIIGPKNEFSQRLPTRSNVHYLGPKPFAELPKYLHNADVGLIPFDVENNRELLDSVNPLKLYEYFACGLPVVATAWDELRRLDSPAILCDTHANFIEGLSVALNQKVSADELTTFAEGFDWNARVLDLIISCQ